MSHAFGALARAIAAIWLGIAHGVGAVVRGIVGGAKDIEPEQRRDGIGLLLVGLALVVAAGVWFEVPGGVMDFVRTVVAGTVGKVGWLVPFLVLLAAWRVMRDPVSNGPVGRQVIGWAAFSFGLLGIVHIANGSPEPVSGDTMPLREGGGAVGYVVSALLLDLLRSSAVVVPLLVLLAFFGLLVITGTPLYRVPDRLRELGDSLLGRRPATEGGDEPTQPIRVKRGSGRHHRPAHGRPGLRLPAARREGQEAARAARPPPPSRSRWSSGSRSTSRSPTRAHRPARTRPASSRRHRTRRFAAAGRAARAVRRHRLHAAERRRPQARLSRTAPGRRPVTLSWSG